MNNITRIGKAGEIIDYLLKHYNDDQIESLCVCMKLKDGSFHIRWDMDSPFLDRIGMATTLVHDLYAATEK